MNSFLWKFPGGIKIDTAVETRERAIQFIDNLKKLGFKSNCIYHLNGSISIRLDKAKQFYVGSYGNVPQPPTPKNNKFLNLLHENSEHV